MSSESPKIIVERNGPYIVRGSVPLVEKSEEMSEFGEPLSWVKGEVLRSSGDYALCRCGKSNSKPFCDDTHEEIGFKGTEAADTGPISDRWKTFNGPKIVIQDDHSICMHSGFCGNRITNIWKMQAGRRDHRARPPQGGNHYSQRSDLDNWRDTGRTQRWPGAGNAKQSHTVPLRSFL